MNAVGWNKLCDYLYAPLITFPKKGVVSYTIPESYIGNCRGCNIFAFIEIRLLPEKDIAGLSMYQNMEVL